MGKESTSAGERRSVAGLCLRGKKTRNEPKGNMRTYRRASRCDRSRTVRRSRAPEEAKRPRDSGDDTPLQPPSSTLVSSPGGKELLGEEQRARSAASSTWQQFVSVRDPGASLSSAFQSSLTASPEAWVAAAFLQNQIPPYEAHWGEPGSSCLVDVAPCCWRAGGYGATGSAYSRPCRKARSRGCAVELLSPGRSVRCNVLSVPEATAGEAARSRSPGPLIWMQPADAPQQPQGSGWSQSVPC